MDGEIPGGGYDLGPVGVPGDVPHHSRVPTQLLQWCYFPVETNKHNLDNVASEKVVDYNSTSSTTSVDVSDKHEQLSSYHQTDQPVMIILTVALW